MFDDFSTFEELDNNKISQFVTFFSNELKFEICSKLPRLTDKENKEREELLEKLRKIEDMLEPSNSSSLTPGNDGLYNTSNEPTPSPKSTKNLKIDSEEYKDQMMEINKFFESVKIKYSNFLELQYISSDILIELYEHLSNIEEHKYSLKNRYFSMSLFLKKMIEKTVIDEFEGFLEEKFKKLKSQALENYDGFWLNALFHCNFSNSNQPSINDLIKYNREFSSLSMIITIELFYNKVEQDLYALLINRLDTRRLIIKFEQRSYWINKNIQPLVYSDDEEWNTDMNRVLNVFLNCLNKMENIQSLSILADKDCSFTIDKQNNSLLSAILVKNKKSIEIFTTCRIEIPESSQIEIIEAVTHLDKLKFLLFKAAKFSSQTMEGLKSYLSDLDMKDLVYVRFCKQCLKAIN